MRFLTKSQRVPRRRDDERFELCITCGHYIYEPQEIKSLGSKAQHIDYIDCQVSINIGLPSSEYGPRRERILDKSLQD